jgi:hypothetical protein
MPSEPTCTTVVLLLGDPLRVLEELPATLASADALGLRSEVLLVCDGPDWSQHPLVRRQLSLYPRPGLLQKRTRVDHPGPLVNRALDWVRTPYFHLLWPGLRAETGATGSLLDALEQHPRASLVYAGEEVAAYRSMIRTAALRMAGGFSASNLQTSLDLDLATNLGSVGEMLTVRGITVPEPRWTWADYPFLSTAISSAETSQRDLRPAGLASLQVA